MLIDASTQTLSTSLPLPAAPTADREPAASLSLVALGHDELAGYPLRNAQIVLVPCDAPPALEATERILAELLRQLDAEGEHAADEHEVVLIGPTAAAAEQCAAAIADRLRARGIVADHRPHHAAHCPAHHTAHHSAHHEVHHEVHHPPHHEVHRLTARDGAPCLPDRGPDPAPTACGAAGESDRGPALDALYPGKAERERIVAALEACRGNQTRAAAILGMSRRTLIHRLERYSLPRPRKPQTSAARPQ